MRPNGSTGFWFWVYTGYWLGYLCHASAHGHFLPSLYPFGRFWLSARIAYNLDRPFQCCKACGKQALTMAMGFGCNAAGVTGCRIIDSPRERLIAILTNSFVPCNGRLPALVTLITLFLQELRPQVLFPLSVLP